MQLVFVEDDAELRDIVAERLRKHRYDVFAAATAEDAMQRLAGGHVPSLVVTDVDLGAGRSGVEFADWLHERWPELRVIFASGCLERLASRARDPRETHLAKPFSTRSLIDLVRRFVPASAEEDGP